MCCKTCLYISMEFISLFLVVGKEQHLGRLDERWPRCAQEFTKPLPVLQTAFPTISWLARHPLNWITKTIWRSVWAFDYLGRGVTMMWILWDCCVSRKVAWLMVRWLTTLAALFSLLDLLVVCSRFKLFVVMASGEVDYMSWPSHTLMAICFAILLSHSLGSQRPHQPILIVTFYQFEAEYFSFVTETNHQTNTSISILRLPHFS